MIRKHFHLLLLLFVSTALTASPLQLRKQLSLCQKGDYLVSYQNKSYTVFHAFEKKNHYLDLEELTVPIQFKKKQEGWKDWMSSGAQGHTSRVMYRIDLDTGHLLSYFSFTEGAWLAVDPTENLISRLMGLSLEKIPESKRRRRGPPPVDGVDTRPVWNPPLVIEGKKRTGALFTAWRGRWPKDGSELADKGILIYLPEGKEVFLQGFPYWLEINGGAGRAHFRVVDSGQAMHSPLAKPHRTWSQRT